MQKKSSDYWSSYIYILKNHGMCCCEFGVPPEYSDHLCSDSVQICISTLDILSEFQTYSQLFICQFYWHPLKISNMPKFSSHIQDSLHHDLIYLSWWQLCILSVDEAKNTESFLDSSISNLSWSPVGFSNFNPSLTTSTLNTLVQSNIICHVKYCSSFPTSISASTLTTFHSTSSREARVALSECESVYVTLPLKSQWLHILFRVESKCL